MTIRVVCKQCSSKLDIREELAGTTRRCPKCKTEFTVPTPVDEEDGVSITEDDAEEDVPVAAESRRGNSLTATPVPAGETDADAPARSTAASDDDDEEDFMPSFLTTPAAEKTAAKTPKPSATDDDEDEDGPVLSIPKTAPAAKPKFKPFDPDEFSEPSQPPRSSKKKELPASLEERPRRTRPVDDEEDDEPSSASSRAKNSRTGLGGRASGFQMPTPGSAGQSDPGLPDPGLAASTGGGARDRAQAARELRQALKESALKGPVETEPQRSIAVDFSILMSEIGLKGLALIAGVILLVPALYFASNAMMGGGPQLPRRGYVTGTVTYNGSPAANATVFFQPVQEQDPSGANQKKQPKVRTSFGMTDNKGQFKLMYMEGIEGVAVGKCRVWLELPPPMIVPGEYTTASVTIHEVKPGRQTIDFPLSGPVKKK
jgi:hypothetical protein